MGCTRFYGRWPRWALALLALLAARPAQAHKINTSYTTVVVHPDTLKVMVRLGERDLLARFALDRNGDHVLWRQEMLEGAPQVFDLLEARLEVLSDGHRVALERREARVWRDADGNVFLNLLFSGALKRLPHELTLGMRFVEEFGAGHKNLTKIMATNTPLQQAVFARDSMEQRFVISAEVSILARIVEFVQLGIEHIFLGYDHIMFLLALIVVGGRLRNLVKIVTAFTVAHSITLVLSALEVLILPSKWIEVGIALTIAYVACENFWLKRQDYRWMLTFTFGLVHGFGFANVLRELGLPTRGLVAALLAFNIGVEIGQVCIVALVFPLAWWLGRQRFQHRVVLGVSAVIFLFGVGWAIERIFELSYMPF